MTIPDNPEILLAQEAARGDPEAFAALFQKYFQAVYNYALALCSDPAEAEDLTQEAFIRAHRSLGGFGPPWNFRTWVFRMTRNLFLDELRRHPEEASLDEAVQASTSSPGPESQAVLNDVASRVRQTLHSLSVRNKEALVLREIHGLSYGEIAEVLETTPAYVKTLLARSRSEFQEAYGIKLLIEEPTEDCHEVIGLLQAYNDGETALDVERFVRGHLKVCKACQKRRRWLLTQSGLLAALIPVAPPPGLAARILEKVGISPEKWRPSSRPARPSRFFQNHPLLLFFGAAILFGTLGWLFFRGPRHFPWIPPSPTGTRMELVVLPSATPGPLQSAAAPELAGDTATPFLKGSPTSGIVQIASPTPAGTVTGQPFFLPGISSSTFYSGGAGCGALDEQLVVSVADPAQVRSVVLFFHLIDKQGSGSTPWNDGVAMDSIGNGRYEYDLLSKAIPAFNSYAEAWLAYQFVATGSSGRVLSRSERFTDITLTMCGKK